MTEAEKELVFSKTMTNTLEGKYIRDIIQDYFDSQEKERPTNKLRLTLKSKVDK